MTPLIDSHTLVPEPWQWLYFGIISLVMLLLCVPIVKWSFPQTPRWLLVPAGLGLLVWLTPYGLSGVLLLHVMLFLSSAPISASVIAAIFCLGAIWLVMMDMFPWVGKQRAT